MKSMEEIAYDYCKQHKGTFSKLTEYSFTYSPPKKKVDDNPKSTIFYMSYFAKIGG